VLLVVNTASQCGYHAPSTKDWRRCTVAIVRRGLVVLGFPRPTISAARKPGGKPRQIAKFLRGQLPDGVSFPMFREIRRVGRANANPPFTRRLAVENRRAAALGIFPQILDRPLRAKKVLVVRQRA